MRNNITYKGVRLQGTRDPQRHNYHNPLHASYHQWDRQDLWDKSTNALPEFDWLIQKYFPVYDKMSVSLGGGADNYLFNIIAPILYKDHAMYQNRPQLEMKLPAYVLTSRNAVIALHTFIQAVDELPELIGFLTELLQSYKFKSGVGHHNIIMLRWFIWRLLKKP